jgi:hypothetical protein
MRRAFAVTQIAASFVLLAGAGMLLLTLLSLQAIRPGFETAHVLAVNIPVTTFGKTPEQVRAFYREVQNRLTVVAGVDKVAFGSFVPWRDGNSNSFAFTADGLKRRDGEDSPRAKSRSVSPGFLTVEEYLIESPGSTSQKPTATAPSGRHHQRAHCQRALSGQDPLIRQFTWTDGLMKFINVSTEPRRIVGVAADVDDERIDPKPTMTVYQPFEQEIGGGRLFVLTHTDPYALVPTVTRTVRDLAADQPVERAATLDDVRAEVLAPDRLNTIVFGGFAGVALAIALVGVGGVLAFSVSGRTREFGVRLAIGSQPGRILTGVLGEGLAIAGLGVVIGAVGGWAIARVAGSYVANMQLPGLAPVLGAALVLMLAAVIASVVPAARAARVNVIQALRAD